MRKLDSTISSNRFEGEFSSMEMQGLGWRLQEQASVPIAKSILGKRISTIDLRAETSLTAVTPIISTIHRPITFCSVRRWRAPCVKPFNKESYKTSGDLINLRISNLGYSPLVAPVLCNTMMVFGECRLGFPPKKNKDWRPKRIRLEIRFAWQFSLCPKWLPIAGRR